MDDDARRRIAIEKFYKIYAPMRSRYNLRMQSRTSLTEDGTIKIYRYENGEKQECICSTSEDEDATLYERATERLLAWKGRMEEKHGRNATDHAR